jgi:hypothetical protein
MYFLQYTAIPGEQSEEAKKVGGAFVNFWIDLPSLAEAKASALDMLLAKGWTARSLEEAKSMSRDECGATGLQYFDQAMVDKTVCVFYLWPVDAADAEKWD